MFDLLENIDFPLEILFVKRPGFAADTLLDGNLGAEEVAMEDTAKGARAYARECLEICPLDAHGFVICKILTLGRLFFCAHRVVEQLVGCKVRLD